MAVLYHTGVAMARVAFRVFGRFEVRGVEAVPPRGPLIVVANHLSNADPPVVVAAVPRRLFIMGKRGLFANRLVAKILKDIGVYPLDRDGKDAPALRWALKLLERDQALLLFPEGTRSRDARMHKAHNGVAYVALRSQAPILPVAIAGSEHIHSLLRVPFPLCRMRVWIGQPFTLPHIQGAVSHEVLEGLTEMIMLRIAAMLPESYRGFYASPQASAVPTMEMPPRPKIQ